LLASLYAQGNVSHSVHHMLSQDVHMSVSPVVCQCLNSVIMTVSYFTAYSSCTSFKHCSSSPDIRQPYKFCNLHTVQCILCVSYLSDKEKRNTFGWVLGMRECVAHQHNLAIQYHIRWLVVVKKIYN